MIAKVSLYNHRHVVFHRLELEAADWSRAAMVAREAAGFWRAPYYSLGRQMLLTATSECLHDHELGRGRHRRVGQN